ncbi:uroporphyrinogen-III synthase [Roseibium hamelinense]|uniref:Uroporphyrinogen-III synthase n=1 Tax=Roseibium hamelinense TaxID=150831 RepID=A0A562SG69_9HYPH|nr:uroporphyrinogen-III synthase [Roseibium hamelinense]MTI42892.1 hypothetical protein [Roseibium hamelinense]TWI79924.1 uroporphyrinogen-III synthase [Roseibium hamelinense]
MRFLVTRPQPDCTKTADNIRSAGHEADEAPLLVETSQLPTSFQLYGVAALAVTSRRVVALLARHPEFNQLCGLPAFAVGNSTAEALRIAGVSTVYTAGSNVVALADLIVSQSINGDVLYPCARDRAGDLEGMLAKRGVTCRTVQIYAMERAPALPRDVQIRLRDGHYTAVLIYSRRTGLFFKELLEAAGLGCCLKNQTVIAMSENAAGDLRGAGCLKFPAKPNEQAMLALALADC